jgi:hypothetical protein
MCIRGGVVPVTSTTMSDTTSTNYAFTTIVCMFYHFIVYNPT